jgi:hypothetical protein
MAKSKIRAASKKKPANIFSNLNKPMDIIEDSSSDHPLIEEIKIRKRSGSFKLKNQEEQLIKVNKSNSDVEINSCQSKLTSPKPTNKNTSFSPFSSKENVNISSENIIEIAKKTLKNVGFTKQPEIPANLIYSENNALPDQNGNQATKLFEFQQTVLNKNLKSESILKSPAKQREAQIIPIIGPQSVKSVSESIKISLTDSVDKLINESSKTRTLSSSALNYGPFISSSKNNTTNEKITKPIITGISAENNNKHLSTEQQTPIYDNFTMPPEASVLVPEFFIYKINQKENEKDTEDELKRLIKAEPTTNNARSFENLNKIETKVSVQSIISCMDKDSTPSKRLFHSKSLKVMQTNLKTKPVNTEENQIDYIHDSKPKQSVIITGKKKVILEDKKENIQNPIKSFQIAAENPWPLKSVSDLIKNLNGEKKFESEPAWKDIVLRKKNI